MIHEHEQRYAHHWQVDRLRQLDLSQAQYQRLKSGLRERAERESQIPEQDVEAAVEHFIAHPWTGARKAHLSLIDQEQAMISSSFCNDIKQQLSSLVMEESERRRVESILEKELQARLAEKQQHFERLAAGAPHDIWATDFLHLSILGHSLYVCMIYEIYSQAYLALQCAEAPNRELAAVALEAASRRTGCRPRHYLLHDNGRAFRCQHYDELLAQLEIRGQPIPPGCPWLNGSLETNNTGLRAAIMTIGIQRLAERPEKVRELTGDVPTIVRVVQDYCDQALIVLNEQIARPKFQTVPQVALDGETDAAGQRHQLFTDRKKAERRQRIAAIRNGTLTGQPKTLEGKVERAARRRFRTMTDEQLHALNQLLRGRYALLAA